MPNSADNDQPLSYTQASERLEEIIQALEDGEIDIDELSANVKEAAQLLDLCKKKIEQADIEVKDIAEHLEIEAESEKVVEEPDEQVEEAESEEEYPF